jgi:hypothetical protein
MIFRIYPSKDTTITNDVDCQRPVRATGSNLGGSEELVLFKRAPNIGASPNLSGSSLARTLLSFDMSRFSSFTGSMEFPSIGSSFFLRLHHKTTACTQPSSFTVSVHPITAGWDEGRGMDPLFKDRGFCNWERRTSVEGWSTLGGDFDASRRIDYHFDTGFEDLEVDITSIVEGWLDGTIENHGLLLCMSSSIESDLNTQDYYQKKFYSRQSPSFELRPNIEVRFNDSISDDRSNMSWGRSGSLFMYNVVDGELIDFDGFGPTLVTISDSSSSLITVPAGPAGPAGMFSASFSLPTGSYSGSIFYDSWGSGSFSFGTGSFSFRSSPPQFHLEHRPLVARVSNLLPEYVSEDAPTMNVKFRTVSGREPVFQTSSLDRPSFIAARAYYAIENDSTRRRVINFGTGSLQETRLSYGRDGNSFKLFMSNLSPGEAYRIVFLVVDQGRQQVIDGGFKFRVV